MAALRCRGHGVRSDPGGSGHHLSAHGERRGTDSARERGRLECVRQRLGDVRAHLTRTASAAADTAYQVHDLGRLDGAGIADEDHAAARTRAAAGCTGRAPVLRQAVQVQTQARGQAATWAGERAEGAQAPGAAVPCRPDTRGPHHEVRLDRQGRPLQDAQGQASQEFAPAMHTAGPNETPAALLSVDRGATHLHEPDRRGSTAFDTFNTRPAPCVGHREPPRRARRDETGATLGQG